MSFFDEANAAIASVFCDTLAQWHHAGAVYDVLVVFDIQLDEYKRDIYKITSREQKLLACPAEHVDGIARKDQIVIDGKYHEVVSVHIDASGWANIVVERVR